jgi:hypothetical protein
MARDGFPKKVVEDVAKRAGYQCSNQGCRRRTVGPSENNSDKYVNIGKASHITAASPGGPRYNANLTPKERKSIANAIHLCADCADLIDKNKGVDFPVDLLLLWKEANESEVWNELKNPRLYREAKKLEKSGLAILEQWNQLLNEGIYKSRFEIVEFFCRYIIPFIQKHPDLQQLVVGWRKAYEAQLIKNDALQKKVLQDTAEAFQKIVEAVVVEDTTEPIKLKIADIQNILNGKPGIAGYTSWPQYREAYWAVKELLQMLFDDGKTNLCACYAILDTRSSYVEKDGKYEIVKELYISEFTYSSTIEQAAQAEREFKDLQLQDPVKVWPYFEAAFYFWNVTSSSIKENLEYLYKVHPLRAASQQAAWFEINQVKSRRGGGRTPLIFTTELFREGLRTIINEMIVASA